MSRRLLKFSGGSLTTTRRSPRLQVIPSCSSRARNAATSCGIALCPFERGKPLTASEDAVANEVAREDPTRDGVRKSVHRPPRHVFINDDQLDRIALRTSAHSLHAHCIESGRECLSDGCRFTLQRRRHPGG